MLRFLRLLRVTAVWIQVVCFRSLPPYGLPHNRVVHFCVSTQEHAGTAHYDVMRELLATTEAKVMLAIDEYNELFQMSHWHYGDNKASAAVGRVSGGGRTGGCLSHEDYDESVLALLFSACQVPTIHVIFVLQRGSACTRCWRDIRTCKNDTSWHLLRLGVEDCQMWKYIDLPRGRFQIIPPSSLPLPLTKPTDTAGSAAPHGNPAAPAAFGLDRHWPGLRGRLGGGPCQPGGGRREKENSCKGGGGGLDEPGDRGGLPAATAGKRHRGVRRVREVPPGEEAEEEKEVGPVRGHRGPAGASRVGKGLLQLKIVVVVVVPLKKAGEGF